MAISSVLSYARARMNALGYTEFTDKFGSSEDHPKLMKDAQYFIELGQVSGVSHNQVDQVVSAAFTVTYLKGPNRSNNSRIASAITDADAILVEFLKASNRLTQASGLKNIRFDSMNLEPLDESNNNGVLVKLDFTALVIIDAG